jgi:cytochrome d ubiquinol oxidase subunit I
MAGVAAYFVYQHHVREHTVENIAFWTTTLKIAIVALVITAPLQVIHGDLYARHVYETQPQKFAAMEALWETDTYVPEYIVAFPTDLSQLLNPRTKDLFGIGIPGGASWLASGGDPQAEIRGLNSFDTEAPPVAIVFWSFRIMVGLGFWFILLAFWASYRWYRTELADDDLLHKALMGSSLLGILAVETGWVVTEVGRQPWVIQDVMRTAEGVSPGLSGTEATFTLLAFVGGYSLLLVLYTYVIRRIIRHGPPTVDDHRTTAENSQPEPEVNTDG